jgi:four helix bundle protein
MTSETRRRVPSSRISDRTFEFACRMVSLYSRLVEKGGAARQIVRQVLDSATSIGANVEEAEAGQTKRDFIARQCIAKKETRETIYWLRLLLRTRLVSEAEISWELNEALQLLSMLTRSTQTAQSSSDRGNCTSPSGSSG